MLAGPGSGKTKTLTAKMARILAEDVEEPRGIACITYNNECARELESRLAALGVEPGGRIFIGTVHSFSLTQIVLPYAKLAGLNLPDGFGVATRADRARALENAYTQTIRGPGNPQDWDFRMGNYRRSILDRSRPEWHATDPELARLVEAFEANLRTLGVIDFDDMPLLAVRALRENEWLQRALLAKYPVLVVDEYQDLGRALHQMVMGLCFSTGMRLFAVGDPDQSIYEFTGAHPELLRRLAERTDVEAVRLRLNYRSGSQIVTASSYALGEDRDYEAAAGAEVGTIYLHPRSGTYEQQANYLFSTVLAEVLQRKPDLQAGDVAVLYPAAWMGDKVAEVAQAIGMPFVRTDGNALYPRSSRLLRWLEQCAEWCCGGWQTGSPRFARLAREGRRLFADEIRTPESQLQFQRDLMAALWSRRDATMSLHQWLIGLLGDVVTALLASSRTMRDEAETLAIFVSRCAIGGNNHAMTLGQFSGLSHGNDSMTLSTLHSSKGREFPVVLMFGLDNGRLPRTAATPSETLEARRLFYVGFTRAKSEVHMIYTANRASPFVLEVQHRLAQQ